MVGAGRGALMEWQGREVANSVMAGTVGSWGLRCGRRVGTRHRPQPCRQQLGLLRLSSPVQPRLLSGGAPWFCSSVHRSAPLDPPSIGKGRKIRVGAGAAMLPGLPPALPLPRPQSRFLAQLVHALLPFPGERACPGQLSVK